MLTVANTDRENPHTTGFARAFKRSARGWEKTCAAMTMKNRKIPTTNSTTLMKRSIGTLLSLASLS
jgi:hypothetical protein